MEINYFTLQEKNKIANEFFIKSDNIKIDYSNNENEIFYVYKIYNKINSKIYIGKTKNIQCRVCNYVNSYLKGDPYSELLNDMIKYGISNFNMIILEVAFSSKSASIKEKYYIDLYDTINYGYNITLNSIDCDKRKYNRVGGHPHTIYSKVVKSKIICAINSSTKEMIFSTGLKLFGDLIGKNKDDIKSFAKRQTKVNGYFIMYMNDFDLSKQLESANSKIIKNSIYSDCNIQYTEFVELVDYIKSFINSNKNPLNYNIKFITQSNTPLGYEYKDINLILPQISI